MLPPAQRRTAPAARSTRTTLATLTTLAAALLAACASPLPPHGQSTAPNQTMHNPDCPDVTRLHAAHLYGSWTLELPQTGQRGHLTLRQHPEFAGSLRGEFNYHGRKSIASGDVEEGEFNLDESLDGKSLHAFWSGQLEPAGCGAEIRGTWQRVPAPGQPEPPGAPFILRRQ